MEGWWPELPWRSFSSAADIPGFLCCKNVWGRGSGGNEFRENIKYKAGRWKRVLRKTSARAAQKRSAPALPSETETVFRGVTPVRPSLPPAAGTGYRRLTKHALPNTRNFPLCQQNKCSLSRKNIQMFAFEAEGIFQETSALRTALHPLPEPRTDRLFRIGGRRPPPFARPRTGIALQPLKEPFPRRMRRSRNSPAWTRRFPAGGGQPLTWRKSGVPSAKAFAPAKAVVQPLDFEGKTREVGCLGIAPYCRIFA